MAINIELQHQFHTSSVNYGIDFQLNKLGKTQLTKDNFHDHFFKSSLFKNQKKIGPRDEIVLERRMIFLQSLIQNSLIYLVWFIINKYI